MSTRVKSKLKQSNVKAITQPKGPMIAVPRCVKRKLTTVEEYNTKICLAHVCGFLNGEGVASIMGLYPRDEQMQQECCRALANTLDEFVSENNKVKYTIARWMCRIPHKTGSADERVITAMRNFSKNECIQKYGCSIIAKLVALAPQKPHFIAFGALDVVCVAMYAFPASRLIQIEGCNAISAITDGKCRKTKRKLDVPEVCDVVVHAMTRFETVEELQVRGLVALTHTLGWFGYNPESLMLLGVPECIIAATQRYPANESIQNLACESFKYLCTADDAIEELLRSGLLDFVFAAMRAFSVSEDIQADGIYILLRIIEQENADLVALVEAGLGEVVFAAADLTGIMDHNRDLIMDVCKIVKHVLLGGRLASDITNKFRPLGGGSVYDQIEGLRGALDDDYHSDGSFAFDKQLDEVAEQLWYLQEKLDANEEWVLTS